MTLLCRCFATVSLVYLIQGTIFLVVYELQDNFNISNSHQRTETNGKRKMELVVEFEMQNEPPSTLITPYERRG